MTELHPAIQGILAVLASLSMIYGTLWGARKARGEAKALKEPPPTPYEALAKRVVDLEIADGLKGKQLGELETKVTHLQRTEGRLIGYVARLHQGISDGTVPPLPPTPDWLKILLGRGEGQI